MWLTPLLLDIMATMGLHVLVAGLYRSADDNSVQSSRPPTDRKRKVKNPNFKFYFGCRTCVDHIVEDSTSEMLPPRRHGRHRGPSILARVIPRIRTTHYDGFSQRKLYETLTVRQC